jgi:catechol 1,2-dioxygenase
MLLQIIASMSRAHQRLSVVRHTQTAILIQEGTPKNKFGHTLTLSLNLTINGNPTNTPMKRSTFIRQSGMMAVGIGVFGRIHWQVNRFVGDTPTTTDILGPFYRPGAPVRTNLNPDDFTGNVLHVSGKVFREDGKTPLNNCLLEVWQCLPDGTYDNVSDEFLYRASLQTGTDGTYSFRTTLPVAYEASPGNYRPAHIHLRVSAPGQQDLITQLYFAGDPHLASDPSTRSPLSLHRILPVKKRRDNQQEIRFDVVLRKEHLPGDTLFHKVSGIYQMNDQSMMEFYREGNLLFYKINNQIWDGLSYAGNTRFTGGVNDTEATFELLPQGQARVQFRFIRRREIRLQGSKILQYPKQK